MLHVRLQLLPVQDALLVDARLGGVQVEVVVQLGVSRVVVAQQFPEDVEEDGSLPVAEHEVFLAEEEIVVVEIGDQHELHLLEVLQDVLSPHILDLGERQVPSGLAECLSAFRFR